MPIPHFYTLLLSLTLLANPAIAERCNSDAAIAAHYRITEKQGPQTRQRDLVLWRHDGRIAHQYPQRDITELWEYNTAGHPRLLRSFDAYQRSIEYAPNEIPNAASPDDWSRKQQLIANSQIAAMQQQASRGEGCEQRSDYTLDENGAHSDLQWLPQQRLIAELHYQRGNYEEHWTLMSVNRDAKAVAAFFAERDAFQSTDYSDIGDNESDPFLSKMINLGFISHGASGIYNSQGQDIGHGHNH
ncbi:MULTISPECIES: hypothetical protein [Spongiibacter]|uniref:hypothetical protein n=1 Tax=Spongiibacter TaxID=630749 RepID=UPI001B0D7726|nr:MULTISPECIES: hypothetical protein [Spongiibacter]MBO6754433.1 hypothetical protein [Spongiibacter sp.]|tara:strand:- start:757 stop:1488 length:732 start_codon:yes stop_codon:yes gene_type:complete